MDKYRHIFSPIKIGGITIKNRIERAPAMPFLATSDCKVSKDLIEWERAFAKGGAGIVTIGDSPVLKDPPSVFGHILNLGTDRIINGLSRLAETIQRYGARASIELTCRTPQSFTSVTDMTRQEIETVIEGYAAAAYRCMSAGMDMIMVHGAHGHFISQFISKKNNLRTDAYRGSFRNRTRFVNEILEAIRDRVGNNLAIEYRISADEYIKDGLSMEEQLEFAQSIQDKIDLIS